MLYNFFNDTNSGKHKELQRLHETDDLLQKEHRHLLARNQVLITFLNCMVFWAVLISSGSEFLIVLALGYLRSDTIIGSSNFRNFERVFYTETVANCFWYNLVFHKNRVEGCNLCLVNFF